MSYVSIIVNDRGLIMIVINGIKIAENNKEAINSLFQPGGTATLFAKRQKRHIILSHANGDPFGVVVNNVIGTATKMEDSKVWYSYGWPKELGNEPSYSDSLAMAKALQCGYDKSGPIYKA